MERSEIKTVTQARVSPFGDRRGKFREKPLGPGEREGRNGKGKSRPEIPVSRHSGLTSRNTMNERSSLGARLVEKPRKLGLGIFDGTIGFRSVRSRFNGESRITVAIYRCVPTVNPLVNREHV